MDPEPDCYAILGVPSTASDHAITLAYRGQIKRVHPDYALGDADRRRRTAASAALNDAYAVLGDPLKITDSPFLESSFALPVTIFKTHSGVFSLPDSLSFFSFWISLLFFDFGAFKTFLKYSPVSK